MKRILAAGLIASCCTLTSPAWAFDPFVVRDIRVEGIQRTEPGTVFSYLPVRAGDTFTEEQATEAVRKLFATGFFSDVKIEVENNVIVVRVDERPAIADITFTGIKEFDKDTLKLSLRDVGLGEGLIFDRSTLERAEQELKRQYLSRGKYGAQITTTVTPLERNRVGLNFAVEEGDIAKIREIRIFGNQTFKTSELLDQFQLTTPGIFTWYTKSDQYSKQKLSADLESLRSFYMDRGYLDFNIDSTQVSISPDKKDIYVTINLTEGQKYTVSSVRLAGNLILPEEEYLKLVQLHPGDVFSRERLTATSQAITGRLGEDGYAFASVNATPEINKENATVAFTLLVDPGRRTYVNRINIGGNVRTRDEVIRREMRQMEGEWYDANKITRSRQRIERLGYFDDVSVDTPPVAGATDQVDVNVNVKERPTNSISLGAGFSSAQKLTLSGSLKQENIFGSGKSLQAEANTDRLSRTYSLSFTDPYYTTDGVSLGYDLYHRTFDPYESYAVARYRSVSTGAGLRIGYPIGEDDTINFGLGFDRTRITTYDESPIQYKDFCRTYGCTGPGEQDSGIGEASIDSVLATIAWKRDSRDSYIYPRAGRYQQLNFEGTVPVIDDVKYIKAEYQFQQWLPIGKHQAFMFNVDLGWAHSFGDKPMPFYKNFYAGGIGSVRGYKQSAIGPHTPDGDALGGTRSFNANFEYFFPMPGMGNDRSVRLSLFTDMGTVWDEDADIEFSDLRYSAGLGLWWSSPIGPLKFSVGYPIKKKPEDQTQRFQFQVGTVF